MKGFRCQREAIRLFESRVVVDHTGSDTDGDDSSCLGFTSQKVLSANQNRRVEEGTAVFGDLARGAKSSLVVMKTLYFSSDQQQRHAERELAFHQTLRHPNLVRHLHASWEGNELRILLEHCKYYDLDHYTGAFTAYSAGRIIAQLLSALHYLHTLPYSSLFFVHGDVKRSNCFLDKDCNQKLGDFGTTRFQEYSEASSKQLIADDQHGVTRSYLPYFLDDTPIVSQCTDIWATHLVITSILGDLTSFFQFSSSASLSHYLRHYCTDLLDVLSGHDPRYAEFFLCFSTDTAIKAYYSSCSDDHDAVRARLRALMHLPPVSSFLSLTPLFSSTNSHEAPFCVHEETASSFTNIHQAYKEETLLTLAAAHTHDEKPSPLTPEGLTKITSRTVYFVSDYATVHSNPFVVSLCEEIENMDLCPKLLDWLIRLGLTYIESPEEFKALWPSMYAELIEIAASKSVTQQVNFSSLPQDDLVSDSFGRERASCFQLSDEFDVIQTALSSIGVQNASYLWSLIMGYVIICPRPREGPLRGVYM